MLASNPYPRTAPASVTQADWVRYITACILSDLELIHDCLLPICSPILCKQIESSKAKYWWVDEEGTPTKISSKSYTLKVLKLGQQVLESPQTFESRSPELLTLYRRVFRVLAHALSRHRKQLEIYGLYLPINSYFSSFTSFATFHGLLCQSEILAGGVTIENA
jgi:Mob1/phocein family